MSQLLTDTTQFSLLESIPPTTLSVPSVPSGAKSPGKKSPRKLSLKLPIDQWNIHHSPTKVRHPYFRLLDLTGGAKQKLKWEKQQRQQTACPLVPPETVTTTQNKLKRKNPTTIPKRSRRTLQLSSATRIERQNESILRRFVTVLQSSRTIYGQNPETLRHLFQTIDTDSSGTIELAEFSDALNRLGLGLLPKEIEELLNVLDDNKDGKVQYNELVASIYSVTQKHVRRHLERATHHTTTKSRNVGKRKTDHQNEQDRENVLVASFVQMMLNQQKSILHSVEMLRRTFAEADENKTGQLSGTLFVTVIRDARIVEGRDSDAAKIALKLQNKQGEIAYHGFCDKVARKLQPFVRRERKKNQDTEEKQYCTAEELLFFENIVQKIYTLLKTSSISFETLSKVEEFQNYRMDSPRMDSLEYFSILSSSGITLSSSALLALYKVLRLDERNSKKTSGGALDCSAADARHIRMAAINEAKIVSKFKVLHKSHVVQSYLCQVETMKDQHLAQFRLDTMMMDDGDNAEQPLEKVLQKIRAAIRMSNDAGPFDVMEIFQLFDVDGNGKVSREEFTTALGLLGCDLMEDETISCFELLDPDGSNGIDLSEFRYAWFNHGKIRRRLNRTDENAVVGQTASLRQKQHEELMALERMYKEKASLIRSSAK